MTSRHGSGGVLSRLMQRSVDRAMRMQPKRTARVRDDLLYAAPANREIVEEIADAGRRIVDGGLAPRTLGAIAARRSGSKVIVTAEGCDLGSIDNRTLETADADADGWWTTALRHGDAAIRAWPPALVAVGPFEPIAGLAERCPAITEGPAGDSVAVTGDGTCLAIAGTVAAAIAGLEIAEHAAQIQRRRST